MPTTTAPPPLPRRTRRTALADTIDPHRAAAVSDVELERLLSGGRAAGRTRVVHHRPGDDILAAVLAGLRRL
ncbi:hypothetical protein HCB17_16820 [Salinispora arenicola]|uniref:Uncharacterized protein n=1 Tax=Salinispora arenicola (strain CNS-205) TaxID=391037 RepID=A8M7U3_SALAI|nr:hypothetical protein [Salinispora arenicola]MCN0180163.1 hypothetical protein [Salinispora arenicola]NIL42628.1 hypothetical protein [Salinispora arenicola]NIL59131.1 hypothetical protein [Salinispora arenicola]NIL63309.1 hypothetical protein [Salinispora arenicola]